MHSSDTLPTRLDLPEDRERARASSAPCRLLVADDQPDVLEALRLLLKGEGYQIDTAASPAGVVAALEDKEFDVVLMDLNYARDTTSGQEGLDLLHTVRTMDPTLPVVVMTAWGSVDVAVEAMRRGARDFVQKPWDNARLLAIVRTQVELSRALRRGQRLEAENLMLRGDGQPHLIADAPAMQPVLQMIARVGPSDANVLITGENGTGKGLVAQALHAVSAARGAAARHRQRRRRLRRRLRERAVRPRPRRLHRRQGRPRRPLRAGRRRHAVPRRDRQRPAQPAGQAAARARDRRVRAPRLVADTRAPTCA